MCENCGCDHGHDHHHGNETRIILDKDVLEKNKNLANYSRENLKENNTILFNIISSPGSGKTSLLESLIPKINRKSYVIEGDQQTSNDSYRLRRLNIDTVQINTGNGCHLDANMVKSGIDALAPENNSFVFIENVGNLVCPSLFDLGENYRIVAISTTEGEDKPLKYPNAFLFADLCIINKIDLLPYLNFNIELLKNNIKSINPNIKVFEVSATKDIGVDLLVNWLNSK